MSKSRILQSFALVHSCGSYFFVVELTLTCRRILERVITGLKVDLKDGAYTERLNLPTPRRKFVVSIIIVGFPVVVRNNAVVSRNSLSGGMVRGPV